MKVMTKISSLYQKTCWWYAFYHSFATKKSTAKGAIWYNSNSKFPVGVFPLERFTSDSAEKQVNKKKQFHKYNSHIELVKMVFQNVIKKQHMLLVHEWKLKGQRKSGSIDINCYYNYMK